MAATVIAIPSPLMILTGLIHLSLLQWEARREEQYLLHAHGPLYGEYLKHVGRFMPKSLLPYHSQR
jgi:protein-S-isoprenylcysteine O-methyltransferase Ste14